MKRRTWGRVRQLPSGRFQAGYVGPDAVRHTAPHTFSGKLYAEAWLVDEHRLIDLGVWTPPAQRAAAAKAVAITVADYGQRWIAEKTKLKERTRIGYESSLANHIVPVLGNVPLRNLTPESVRAWFAGLGKDHPTRNAHAYALLHAICATAVGDGLLAANPCVITGAMHAPAKRQAVILEPAEVAALADALNPKRLRMLVLLAAWCGPRWGEAQELRRKDVSADCSVLAIDRAATHRGACRIDTPKSGVGRKVVVPPHLRDGLREHLERYVGPGSDALLFPAVHGCHLNDRVFRDYFTDALTAIGREGVRFHDLRHFCGTTTARVGNLKETMDRLGHSTVKASLIYQQIAHGRDAEVADALSRLAGQPTAAEEHSQQ